MFDTQNLLIMKQLPYRLTIQKKTKNIFKECFK